MSRTPHYHVNTNRHYIRLLDESSGGSILGNCPQHGLQRFNTIGDRTNISHVCEPCQIRHLNKEQMASFEDPWNERSSA